MNSRETSRLTTTGTGRSRQTTSYGRSDKSAASKSSTDDQKQVDDDLDPENLSPEVLAEYREAFSLFDEDGDENITTSELSSVFRSLGQNPYDDHIAEMIRDVDSDGDGLVSFQEFLVMMIKSTKMADTDDDLREAFQIFTTFCEANEFGLNAQGLKAIMNELGDKITDEEANQMVRLADRDQDGFVNFEEFARLMKSI